MKKTVCLLMAMTCFLVACGNVTERQGAETAPMASEYEQPPVIAIDDTPSQPDGNPQTNAAVEVPAVTDSGIVAIQEAAGHYTNDYIVKYESVIEKYREAYETGNNTSQYALENGLSEVMASSSGAGYALVDLDGNGIPELIIAGFGDEDFSGGVIYDLYTLVDGVPVNLSVSSTRSCKFLLRDNSIYHEGSSGAAYSFFTVEHVNGDRLEETEMLFRKEDVASNEIHYYYQQGDSESLPSEKSAIISEEEFLKKLAQWESMITIPPLTVIYGDKPLGGTIPEMISDGASEVLTSMITPSSGYLLKKGFPAAGQMRSTLYYTEDGQTWNFVRELQDDVHNFPKQLYFWSESDGIILTDYHGFSDCVYRTQDGGKTWNPVTIEIPSEIAEFLSGYNYLQGENVLMHDAGVITVELSAHYESQDSLKFAVRIEDGHSSFYVDDMGSGLVLSNDNGRTCDVWFGVYKVSAFERTLGEYDLDTDVLHFTAQDLNGKSVTARVKTENDYLVVTITDWDYEEYLPNGTELVFYEKK